MNYQWYPGHMTKAVRAMKEDIKLIDLVVELLDARAPLSSRNPDIDSLAQGKFRLVILNKCDLSDPAANAKWKAWFEEQGIPVTLLQASDRGQTKKLVPAFLDACKEKIERDKRRGIKNRPIRVMITGIPNVGKSTLINSITGRSSAKTGDKPGVTRGRQWIHLDKNVELLDTPGILWPKFDDQMIGVRLALAGSIRDEIIDSEELATYFTGYLRQNYPGVLEERYGATTTEDVHDADILSQIAINRGALGKGGEPDTEKAAVLMINDLRSKRLGKISLEFPPVTD